MFFTDVLANLDSNYTIYYKNNEKKFDGPKKHSFYFLDFFIEELNIGFEFNGDYCHANPDIYEEEEEEIVMYSRNNIVKAKDVWKKDKVRNDFLLNKYGVKIYVLWEKNVDLDRDKAIEEVLEVVRRNKKG